MFNFIQCKLFPLLLAETLTIELRDFTKRELVIAETVLENSIATRDMLKSRLSRLEVEIKEWNSQSD